MILKELIDELGGGRSLTLGSLLCILLYLAASNYLASNESRVAALEKRQTELVSTVARLQHLNEFGRQWATARRRATTGREARLIERIERLEIYHDAARGL